MRFAVIWGENLLESKLPLCVQGGDERRKKKSREERERGCREGAGVATGKKWKKGGARAQ